MPLVSDRTRQRAKTIVCTVLGLDSDEVTDTSLFVEDHGAGSTQTVELLASLEIDFKVAIDESELEHMVNLAGVYRVLGNWLADRGTAPWLPRCFPQPR